MPIYKRGKTWWITINQDGRQIRKSTKTSDRASAQELHDQLIQELNAEKEREKMVSRLRTQGVPEEIISHLDNRHGFGSQPQHSLDEAAERWLREKAEARSFRDVKYHLDWWCDKARGMDLRQITKRWVAEQIEGLVSRKGTPATNSTRNRYVGTLRAVLRMAANNWEWIPRAPELVKYKSGRKVLTYFTPEQAKELIAVLPEEQKAPIAFAFMTGMRKSNVYGLEWDQVDLERSVCWIRAEDAKAGKAIVVPLNRTAIQILVAQPRVERKVFPVPQVSHHSWKRYLGWAGLPKHFRFHDIRHTFASWHTMAGTDMRTLQELGGWASLSMVQRYSHLSADHLSSAASKIEGRLL